MLIYANTIGALQRKWFGAINFVKITKITPILSKRFARVPILVKHFLFGQKSAGSYSIETPCMPIPSGPKLLQKTLYKENVLEQLILEKQIPWPVSCKRDTPVAATLQRNSSVGINFVIITKIITKENVPRNYFVIISARMVQKTWDSSTDRFR